MSDAPLAQLAAGFRKRTWKTAKLAAAVGVKALKKNVGLGGKGASPGDDVDEAEAVRRAEALLGQLDEMKGLMLKLGQMASYLEGSLPPSAQKVLAQLQSSSRAMTWDAVAEVIADDLGRPPEAAFASIAPEPFAAASIGQVHRATLADGQAVAVKVQYPGVDKAIKSDLRTLGTIARFGTAVMPMSGGALVKELSERLAEECDYVREAANQRLFANVLSSYAGASVPAVIGDLSGARVLTTEFVDRMRFAEFVQTATQEAKNRAGLLIYRACIHTVFNRCVFNGDPHPGNYLLTSDGDVTFLDFGCVKHYPASFIDAWKELARSVNEGRRDDFPAAVAGVGFVGRKRGFDYDAMWAMLEYIYEPFLSAQPYTYTSAYVKRSFDALMWDNPNRMKMGMPPEWLLLNRLQWGLNSILSALNASGDFREAWLQAIYSPTEPVPAPNAPG